MQKTWSIIPKNSHLNFYISNAGFKVKGFFRQLDAQVSFDPQKPEKSTITGMIKSDSINTSNFLRDSHLRMADYFYASKYPLIEYKSDEVIQTDGGYLAKGELSIKGKTYQLEIPFQTIEDGEILTLQGNFTVNRLDYNIGPKSIILANEARIDIRCTLTEKIESHSTL